MAKIAFYFIDVAWQKKVEPFGVTTAKAYRMIDGVKTLLQSVDGVAAFGTVIGELNQDLRERGVRCDRDAWATATHRDHMTWRSRPFALAGFERGDDDDKT